MPTQTYGKYTITVTPKTTTVYQQTTDTGRIEKGRTAPQQVPVEKTVYEYTVIETFLDSWNISRVKTVLGGSAETMEQAFAWAKYFIDIQNGIAPTTDTRVTTPQPQPEPEPQVIDSYPNTTTQPTPPEQPTQPTPAAAKSQHKTNTQRATEIHLRYSLLPSVSQSAFMAYILPLMEQKLTELEL